jgi:hypothetical protein
MSPTTPSPSSDGVILPRACLHGVRERPWPRRHSRRLKEGGKLALAVLIPTVL